MYHKIPFLVGKSTSVGLRVGRSHSLVAPGPKEGIKDVAQRNKALKMHDTAQRKMNQYAKAGESDRIIQTKMPKHLFSGKRGKGKTERR